MTCTVISRDKETGLCTYCGRPPVKMYLPVHPDLSHNGTEYMKWVEIDACIADIVGALNRGGMKTKASCCGHGKLAFGTILLADGRELLIKRRELEKGK